MRVRFFGHHLHLSIIFMALIEAVAFTASLYVASWVRFGGSLHFETQAIVPLLPRALTFATVTLVSFLALGLYTTRQRARVVGIGLRILVATLAAMAVTAMLFFMIPSVQTGRGVLAIAAMVAAVAAIITRAVFMRFIDIEGLKRRVLIYGQSEQLVSFTRMRRRTDRAGFNLVGVVNQNGDENSSLRIPTFTAPNGLYALCAEQDIDELVVALYDRRERLPTKDLLQCRLAGINVIDLISFMERETGQIQLDLLMPSWIIFGDGFRRDGLRLFTARALDFVASAVLLLVTSPIMLVTAMVIWLEDGWRGGKVFYRQDRVGYNGRIFPLLKFRSMRSDAEVGGTAQWAVKQDPRVTKVGRCIRLIRVDELPQLLNVFQGHMGFVGPRPERPEFVQSLQENIPYYAYRHSVKPGITGWAQVCISYGASVEAARLKLQYDLYYVKNHNLLFDLAILVQTAEVVLMGKGAR